MAKQPGEGPPWPKGSNQQEEKGTGEYAKMLARADKYLDDAPEAQPMERTDLDGGASVRIAPGAKKSNRPGRRERTQGKKVTKKKRDTESAAPEVVAEYGVPVVTDGITETRKEKKEALRDAILRSKELAELRRQGSGEVIALPDQSEETKEDEIVVPFAQGADLNQPEENLPTKALNFREIAKGADSQIERSDMELKEQAYLAAYKELEQKRTIWNRLSKGKELKVDEEKVEALKNDFNQARITYAAAIEKGIREPGVQNMSEAFVSRMTERYEKLRANGTPPLDAFGREQTLRDYLVREEVGRREKVNSYITFREVVRPLAEKKLQARVEALDARGQGAFVKGLAWIGAQNQKLDELFGKNGARAVRAAASTLVIGLGAGAVGSFGTMGLLAVAGWGSVKFARAFGAAMIAAAAGEAGALAYEKLRGRSEQEKARIGVLHEGRDMQTSYFGESTITNDSLERLDQKRETLASRADESTLQKKKALVKALVAMGVGAGAAATLAEYTSVQQAADNVVEATSGRAPEPAGVAAAGSAETVSTQAPSVENTPSSAAEAAPVSEAAYITPVAPEGLALHEASIGRGEGFNQLVVDLRASGFTGFDSELSATELSEKFGAFYSDTGKSGMMLEGDKLLVDAKGNVWFERNGETQLLMENKGGEIVSHKLEGIEMRATNPTAAPVHESVAPVTSNEAASSEVAGTPTPIENDSPVLSDTSNTPSEVSEVPNVVGRPLEGFGDHVMQSQPSDLVERVPERSGGTIGTPLENFRAQPPQAMEIETPEASLVNSYGVEINDAVPSTYEWKVPGMDRTLTVSSGGSPEERSAFARAYANEHPGTTVHFITPVLNNGVVQLRLDAWDSAEGGPAQRLEDIAVRESTGAPVQSFSRIDPRDFIKKLP